MRDLQDLNTRTLERAANIARHSTPAHVVVLQQELHGIAFTRRERINGQPNGYAPITEGELKAQRAKAAA